jgi:hypothetical protein
MVLIKDSYSELRGFWRKRRLRKSVLDIIESFIKTSGKSKQFYPISYDNIYQIVSGKGLKMESIHQPGYSSNLLIIRNK